MAKSNALTKRKKGATKAQAANEGVSPEAIPDAVMAFLQNRFFGGMKRTGNAEDQAQDLMYNAWQAPSLAAGIQLAQQALQLDPDCVDALSFLGSRASTKEEAIRLMRQALAAGQKKLGKKFFEENAGDFWLILETRPYMRARQALAELLWKNGDPQDRDEAIAHYEDMLRLNPGDNQGLRYTLLDAYLALGKDKKAETLHGQYDDGMAAWEWARVLLDFRAKDDSKETRKALIDALKSNLHVPPYLLGRKKLPKQLPDLIGIGDVNEAIAYVSSAIEGWQKTPGALRWLENTIREFKNAPV